MSVKLPLLGAAAQARPPASGGSEWIEPSARAVAPRPWIALLGSPADESPARFACALAAALGPIGRYALLSESAPLPLEHALRESGATVLRAPAGDAELLANALTAVPAGMPVLVVEAPLAAQLRGLLDVWVGPPPGALADPQLLRLHAAADLVLPGNVERVATALGAALARRLADIGRVRVA